MASSSGPGSLVENVEDPTVASPELLAEMPSRLESVNAALRDMESDLAGMKETATNLTNQLDALRSSILEQKRKFLQLQNQASQVNLNSLSDETIGVIFKIGVSSSGSSEDDILTISHVCHRWRTIAIATPSLWNSIWVGFFDTEAKQELVGMFLKRSANAPLDVTIHLERGLEDTDWDPYIEQFHNISPSIARWRSLSLQANFQADVFHAMMRLGNGHMPILENFKVKVGPYDYEEDDENVDISCVLNLFGGGAPMLKTIHINGVPLNCCRPPLGSVQSLYLKESKHSMDRDQFRDVVTSSHSLSSMWLDDKVFYGGEMFGFAYDRHPKSARIVLPSVRSFTINPPAFDVNFMYYVFRNLHMPFLEHLTVWGIPGRAHVECLGEVVRDTENDEVSIFPELKSLTLHFMDFSFTGGHWLLAMLPSVEYLKLRTCFSPQIMLSMLHGNLEDESELPSWPLLKSISISSAVPETIEELCSIVSERLQLNIPLQSVVFGGLENVPQEKLVWLRARVRVEVSDLATQI